MDRGVPGGGGGSIRASGRLEFELFSDHCGYFGECTGTDSESSFDDASLAADVLSKVEDCGLALAERTHHFKTHDRRVGRLQYLEASHWTDELLQLAMIGLDDIVEVLNLSMHRFLRTLAFVLQF